MKRHLKTYARFLALALRWWSIAPSALFGLIVAGVVRLAWGKTSRWDLGIWWVILSEKSWPMRTWYRKWGGTTFGPLSVMLAPSYERNAEIVAHEAHHAKQMDAYAFAAFVTAVTFASLGHYVLAVLAWSFLGVLVYVGGHIAAFGRGENAYTGNVMEQGAYAVGREAGQ
jgi:hypothetical protein